LENYIKIKTKQIWY